MSIQRLRRDTEKAGAFLNLYRVIGENCHGVPETDSNRPTEWAEMEIAKRWLLASREKYETVSKEQMFREVAEFILSNKDWLDR